MNRGGQMLGFVPCTGLRAHYHRCGDMGSVPADLDVVGFLDGEPVVRCSVHIRRDMGEDAPYIMRAADAYGEDYELASILETPPPPVPAQPGWYVRHHPSDDEPRACPIIAWQFSKSAYGVGPYGCWTAYVMQTEFDQDALVADIVKWGTDDYIEAVDLAWDDLSGPFHETFWPERKTKVAA